MNDVYVNVFYKVLGEKCMDDVLKDIYGEAILLFLLCIQ